MTNHEEITRRNRQWLAWTLAEAIADNESPDYIALLTIRYKSARAIHEDAYRGRPFGTSSNPVA